MSLFAMFKSAGPTGFGYEHVHYTRPQTLAFALADSPVGLASWILEKFQFWSDHGDDLLSTFPPDMLIDN